MFVALILFPVPNLMLRPVPAVSPYMTSNATIWSCLGPTDEQRFYVTQVSLGEGQLAGKEV